MDDGILLNFAPAPQSSNKASGAKAKGRQQQNRKRPPPAAAPASASPTINKKPRLSTSTPAQSQQQQKSTPQSAPQSPQQPIAPSPAPKAKLTTQSQKSQPQQSGPKTFISSLFPRTITESAKPISTNENGSSTKVDIAPTNAPSLTGPTTFKSLQLHPFLVSHLTTRMEIQRPTAIQRRALPALLQAANTQHSLYPSPITTKQHDFMIHSQTGSGKTLTYLLPIVHHLLPLSQESFINRSIGTMGIILAPTRELARQIYDVLERVLSMSLRPEESDGANEEQEASSKHYSRWLVPCLLTGGATRTHEKSRLRKGCPLIVSTPGRLLDHLQNTSTLDVGKLQWLVLDEADRLMDLGFEETLQEIVKLLDVKRKVAISKARLGIAENQDAEQADSAEGESDSDDEDWDKKLQREEAKMGIKTARPKVAAIRKSTTAQSQLIPESELADSLGIQWWKVPRRTVLCSATLDESVQKLAGATLREPLVLKPTIEDEKAVQEAAELDAKTQSTAPESSTSGQKDKSDASAKNNTSAKFMAPAQLAQHFVVVPPKLRLVTLLALLRAAILSSASSGRGENRVIVFLSCTDSVDFHWRALGGIKMDGQGGTKDEDDHDDEAEEEGDSDDQDGENKASRVKANAKGQAKSITSQVTRQSELLPDVPIFRLHGSMTQAERVASLRAFTGKLSQKNKSQKNGKDSTPASTAAVLLCTSVAARGLDLPSVRTVIQLDAPTEGGVEEYVHRIGRTARVGKSGESWLILLESERSWVQVLESGIAVEVRRDRDGAASENRSKQVEIAEERVEAVLAKGFGGQAREFEYEARATDVQLAFERWVLSGEEPATLARKAFLSHIRAYATHPASEKHIFHTKFLHLGHLAKAFALREAPGAITKLAHTPSKKIALGAAKGASTGRSKGVHDKGSKGSSRDAKKATSSSSSARPIRPLPGAKGAASNAKSGNSNLNVPSVGDAEARMYAKVRAMGKTSKKGGTLGAYGADEFQIG
ncbi:ATP-dependent RNA helicase dbp7 [Tilletia horrida]|uniref:ATP-dependent RNA helicase n=1 Tax=Tilletia horrida TaxID=155126 RepID=A0AAN6GV57_9BASI|nr:ATP-dependent RNA helicase dbp7 [Tilletia horrida]KAK0567832.1 ATP-dependent RNA helicase dbp7 [Tilletia horrida]